MGEPRKEMTRTYLTGLSLCQQMECCGTSPQFHCQMRSCSEVSSRYYVNMESLTAAFFPSRESTVSRCFSTPYMLTVALCVEMPILPPVSTQGLDPQHTGDALEGPHELPVSHVPPDHGHER